MNDISAPNGGGTTTPPLGAKCHVTKREILEMSVNFVFQQEPFPSDWINRLDDDSISLSDLSYQDRLFYHVIVHYDDNGDTNG